MEEIVIMPSDTYMVTKLAKQSYLAYDVLTLLYQPILEADAYSLLMLLWAEVEREPITHSVIFNTLNINIKDFVAMRSKLEGIGLLRTYENHNEKYHSFIYALQEPMTPSKFFADEVLSTLLLDIVGEERFRKLAFRFEIDTQIPRDYQEVTKSFSDTYTFSEQVLVSNQNVLAEATQTTKKPPAKVLKLRQNMAINFEVLLRSLNTRIVDLDSVRQSKEMIITIQKLYNIEFNDLIQLITKAADLQTGQVTPRTIQKVAVNEYQTKSVEHRLGSEQIIDWQQKGFDKATIEVFDVAVKSDPEGFLSGIKVQKGGQETAQEFYTLRNAMGKSSLPLAVINIVIYWLLVVKGYQELPQKLFDRLLDSLGQQDIIEVSVAWRKLPELLSNNKQTKNYSQRKAKKIIKADWKTDNDKQIAMTNEEIAKLQEELSNL